ncbi:MAG: Fic family protein [Verrucomicrobiales bacterium]|nr:Fic family protein [Verrucomicrobiales bacterium]
MLPEAKHIPTSLRLVELLAQIEEFKGRWRELTWLSPDVLKELRRSATIESIGSSTRIEGSQLTDRQVETLLNNLGKEPFQSRDEEEVAGYAEAMNLVFDAHDILPLTENHVLQLHAVLLQHSTKDQRHRGAYKTLGNHVSAFDADGTELGVIFQTTSPFDTPREMEALTAWLLKRETQKDVHPLLVIGIYIVVFLKIHPFQDGNGRLSRIVTTLLLLRAGYAYVPYLSLESIVEQNKDGYYRALRATQNSMAEPAPDWLSWLEFFLLILWRQAVGLTRKIEALEIKLRSLSEAERRLLTLIQEREALGLAAAVEATGANRETVRKRLARLVAKGFLAIEGKGRGAFYRPHRR